MDRYELLTFSKLYGLLPDHELLHKKKKSMLSIKSMFVADMITLFRPTLLDNLFSLKIVTSLTLVPSLVRMVFSIGSMIQINNIIKKNENLVEGMNQVRINHDRTPKLSATSMITIIIFLYHVSFTSYVLALYLEKTFGFFNSGLYHFQYNSLSLICKYFFFYKNDH
jgi:hypothetical protein